MLLDVTLVQITKDDAFSFDLDLLSSIPDGYTITIIAARLDPNGDGPGDDGIQKITVTIEHPDGDEVITLDGYKADR